LFKKVATDAISPTTLRLYDPSAVRDKQTQLQLVFDPFAFRLDLSGHLQDGLKWSLMNKKGELS